MCGIGGAASSISSARTLAPGLAACTRLRLSASPQPAPEPIPGDAVTAVLSRGVPSFLRPVSSAALTVAQCIVAGHARSDSCCCRSGCSTLGILAVPRARFFRGTERT
ncbi:hypothetical protein NDU88_009676 [Pleurodeles waltl]|uniref:Uncharacterized protein n=1 Tax=Pleurodeles waltl TaxID=8319 RepID=A0AAV7QS88_PLEWA|nr:hypothetical protein NDU88_009676 [Pleurodeles waltl]